MDTVNEIEVPEAGAEDYIQSQMQNPDVIARLDGMEPAERAETLRRMYQDYQGQGALNTEAMSQADALRNTATPEGVQAGNQYVAASPLSHLAKGVKDVKGNMDYRKAQAAQQALSGDKTQGVMDMAKMYLNKLGGNQPQAGEGSLNAAKGYSDALRYKG
jgi:hypothetical protein